MDLSALLIAALPAFFTDAGVSVDDLGYVVENDDPTRETVIDCRALLRDDITRADITDDIIDAGAVATERVMPVAESSWLASFRVEYGESPAWYFIVTYHNDGTVADALYAGRCDDRSFLSPVAFADSEGNSVELYVEYNSIVPACEITPEGHPALTIFNKTVFRDPVTDENFQATNDEITIAIDNDGTMTLTGIRPGSDALEALTARYQSVYDRASLLSSLRSELLRFTPYSSRPTPARLRQIAADEDNDGMTARFFLLDPDGVARAALADKTILMALARADSSVTDRALQAITDTTLRDTLADALKNTPLN